MPKQHGVFAVSSKRSVSPSGIRRSGASLGSPSHYLAPNRSKSHQIAPILKNHIPRFPGSSANRLCSRLGLSIIVV